MIKFWLMAGPLTSSSTPQSPRDFQELFQRVRPQMAALDVFMRDQVERFEPEIRSLAAYCLDTTGKRLRPTLVFICSWRGAGVVADDLVRVAGVVEMVHLATLVHDDIMDRADLRRNRQTAAREFGPEAAVLLGDVLFLRPCTSRHNFLQRKFVSWCQSLRVRFAREKSCKRYGGGTLISHSRITAA